MIRPNRVIERGFTLVELLVVMVVTGIMVAVVMSFMANGLVSSARQSARSELLTEVQNTLDVAQDDIRLSASAEDDNRWLDNNAPSAPGNLYSWRSNASVVILATAAQDNAGNILFEDKHKYITHKDNYIYFVSGGTLYKRILAAPVSGNRARTTCPATKVTAACPADKVLLRNVESFSVRYISGQNTDVLPPNARSIELSVKVKTVRYGNSISAAYTTRTVFRND